MRKTVTLTEGETEKVREVIKLRGLRDTAKALGLHRITLAKAVLGEPVHTLTASVIRGRLQVL